MQLSNLFKKIFLYKSFIIYIKFFSSDIENILLLHESIKPVGTFFSMYLQCQISFRRVCSPIDVCLTI